MRLRWRFAQFMELWWWRRYLSGKDVLTYLDWKRNYWNAFLERAGVSPSSGAAVLDAGCGPAGIFIVLGHCRVDAVDPLCKQYAKAFSHFRPNAYPHVQFIEKSLEAYHPGKTYDVVFCLNAINHAADIDAGIRQLRQLLQPDGQLILSVDVHRFWWLKWLFRYFPADILHPQQHDLHDYNALLRKHGFALQRTVRLKRAFLFDYYLFICKHAPGDPRD